MAVEDNHRASDVEASTGLSEKEINNTQLTDIQWQVWLLLPATVQW